MAALLLSIWMWEPHIKLKTGVIYCQRNQLLSNNFKFVVVLTGIRLAKKTGSAISSGNAAGFAIIQGTRMRPIASSTLGERIE